MVSSFVRMSICTTVSTLDSEIQSNKCSTGYVICVATMSSFTRSMNVYVRKKVYGRLGEGSSRVFLKLYVQTKQRKIASNKLRQVIIVRTETDGAEYTVCFDLERSVPLSTLYRETRMVLYRLDLSLKGCLC